MSATDPKPSPTEVPTGAELGMMRAVLDALIDKTVDFYPRIVSGGVAQSLNSDAVLKETSEASAKWLLAEANNDLDAATKLARESLTEVSKQTEYQDQKATRLLTVTTFLTAFAGVLFTRFLDAYPIISLRFDGPSLLVSLSYLSFAAFVLAALLGALVVFHATRTRFKYPKHSKISPDDSPPKSLLFYTGIIRARPRAWMNGWVDEQAGDKPAVRTDLKQRYFQNLVSETYLVAAKTADKLRYLQPAQRLLAHSLKCLLIWLVLFAATTVFISPPSTPSAPMQVQLSEPVALPAPTVVIQTPPQTAPRTPPPPAPRTTDGHTP